MKEAAKGVKVAGKASGAPALAAGQAKEPKTTRPPLRKSAATPAARLAVFPAKKVRFVSAFSLSRGEGGGCCLRGEGHLSRVEEFGEGCGDKGTG